MRAVVVRVAVRGFVFQAVIVVIVEAVHRNAGDDSSLPSPQSLSV